MYIPKAFEVTDRNKLLTFIRDHSFGILFSEVRGAPFATHLPFVLEDNGGNGLLLSHMAKANTHWEQLDGQEVLVVFSGPHAFVSSAWYQEQNVVPTWNYAAVHVYGRCRLITDRDVLKQVIKDTLAYYEPDSHVLTRLDEAFFHGLLHGIIGFKIDLTRIEGKWKLNQNHSVERQKKIVAGLLSTDDADSHAIATMMQNNLKGRNDALI